MYNTDYTISHTRMWACKVSYTDQHLCEHTGSSSSSMLYNFGIHWKLLSKRWNALLPICFCLAGFDGVGLDIVGGIHCIHLAGVWLRKEKLLER